MVRKTGEGNIGLWDSQFGGGGGHRSHGDKGQTHDVRLKLLVGRLDILTKRESSHVKLT